MSRFRLYDLNPEQQRAATHESGPLLILAGAGTGKTRTIVARITWLVSTGVDPAKILAVTFTNKAAGEMRERVRHLLGEDANGMWLKTFHSACVMIFGPLRAFFFTSCHPSSSTFGGMRRMGSSGYSSSSYTGRAGRYTNT